MPKITVAKDKMKGREPHPEGIYEFRVQGFKPGLSKKKDSVNLNPLLRIVNHPTLNGKPIFFNCNTNAGWLMDLFLNSIGLEMVKDVASGDYNMPGDFNGPEGDPAKWQYAGPIIGRTGKCELILTDDTKGGKRNEVKQWFCAPGFTPTKKD